jgi:hypothetical protein
MPSWVREKGKVEHFYLRRLRHAEKDDFNIDLRVSLPD